MQRNLILTYCRRYAATFGLDNLNIRDVAESCRISVGTIYNLFPSKEVLLAETIRDVWRHVLKFTDFCVTCNSFPKYVDQLYTQLFEGTLAYPGLFSGKSSLSVNMVENGALEAIEEFYDTLVTMLLDALHNDPDVKKGLFTEDFSRLDFIEFVFFSMLTSIGQRKKSCKTLTEIIARIIY